MARDETTIDIDDLEKKEIWQYYVSSFARVEPTEGIPRRELKKSLLTRNLSAIDSEPLEHGKFPTDLVYKEDLIHLIDVNTYKIIYKKEIPSSDWFVWDRKDKPFGGYGTDGENSEPGKTSSAGERLKKVTNIRNERFREKFALNNAWMKGKDREEVDRIKADFQAWISGEKGVAA
jgi:paired amphipathic helix protein Sin3a